MSIRAAEWNAVPPTPKCALCDSADATSTLVPTVHTVREPGRERVVHLHSMKLCEPCRRRVVAGRAKLGWSWRAERWGKLGSTSPDGDKYVKVS
jgi:hypothetical protein